MNFEEAEDINGIRFAWNALPSTKVEAGKVVVPTGVIYTPLKQREDLPVAVYDPIFCSNQNCKSILNLSLIHIYI